MEDDLSVGPFDALVLAGGAARRLGGADKGAVIVDGATLLARAVGAVAAASRVVVVGPPRVLPVPVVWTRESPAGGGPVAAVAAGLPLTSAAVVVVLAADLPWVAPAISPLVTAAGTGRVAALIDATGRTNYLAAAWPRAVLESALRGLGARAGAAMRTLFAGRDCVLVPDGGGWGQDCDTWADVAAARAPAGEGLRPAQSIRSSPA